MTVSLSPVRRRYFLIAALLALVLWLLLFLAAPGNNRNTNGSTFGYGPDGYGAWYAHMEAQGAKIARWQRPLEALLDQVKADPSGKPATLVRVMPGGKTSIASLIDWPQQTEWLAEGNALVLLSVRGAATEASFMSELETAWGPVTVDTRHRIQADEWVALPSNGEEEVPRPTVEKLLADDAGIVAGKFSRESGWVTLVVAPYLGANAYLKAPGNFAFLESVVTAAGGPIWVDEYLHGFKDEDVVVEEVGGSWIAYLAKTPVLIAVVQAGFVILVALIANNVRPGFKKKLRSPQLDNSEAYLQALAGVLRKANSHDFLVETLTRAERKTLQRALGLGDAPVSQDTLQTAWQQATGRSVAELTTLSVVPKSESALREWLKRVQSLHTTVERSDR